MADAHGVSLLCNRTYGHGFEPALISPDLEAEVMRFSPRQSDVMIVAGTVTYKRRPQPSAGFMTKWLNPSGSSPWEPAQVLAVCTAATPSFRVSIGLCRWTFISAVAPRAQKPFSMLLLSRLQDKVETGAVGQEPFHSLSPPTAMSAAS